MNLFSHISIEGYRRLHKVDIEMRPLTVMIGANGVGKTSLLEVFSLLAASGKGQLQSKLSELGGLNEIITRNHSDSISIRTLMDDFHTYSDKTDNYVTDYNLKLVPEGIGYKIDIEELYVHLSEKITTFVTFIKSHGQNIEYLENSDFSIKDLDADSWESWAEKINLYPLISPNWEYNLLETALSQVPKNYQEAESFRKKLASCTFYGALNVAPKSPVRLPQTMRPATLPGANGEDLVSCLYYLRETEPERFELIEDTLKAAFPDFERLAFPPVAAGTLTMTWKDKNFSKPLYMHQLSEGTLRFLWLITLLQSPDLPSITLIDEPEVSLHPELLRLLVDVMREASQRTQLIVATHSDRLIRFLEPKEVLVCDAEDGLAKMTWGDAFDLAHWLEDYSLDEIWAMNLIGGRP